MPNSPEHDNKRRKVRKGTHSCWECRRRKIRCQYASQEDRICIGCQGRGTTCISQEYVDEQLPPQPDRRLAQRLGRLEELMERLVEKIVPEAAAAGAGSIDDSFQTSPSASIDDSEAGFERGIDVLEASIAENAPVLSLLGMGGPGGSAREQPALQQKQQSQQQNALNSIPTPESDHHSMSRGQGVVVASQQQQQAGSSSLSNKHEKTSRTLYALFPEQHDINIVVNSSAGALFVLSLFHTARDYVEGRTESPAALTVIPPPTSHPAVLAKRLLQLIVCLQQLSPSFDEKQLWLRKSLGDTMSDVVNTVTTLVTSNDELVGSVEGLECLILQSFYQANAGNLRKSWLSIRRAMSLAQLMGVDRRTTKVLRSCDPRSDPLKRAAPSQLWNRINFCDRYLSLLLGLPVGTVDDSFASEENTAGDTAMERLEKLYSVISGRIIERNRAKPNEAYALTQAIDCEFEAAAKTMGTAWWGMPSLNPFGTPQQMILQMTHMMLQIHHYSLLILLHLPYMLRDPREGRYDYSKATCLRASREVLRRFLVFRSLNNAAYSCRHVDYSSLMAAMTLILGHLGQRVPNLDTASLRQRQEDKALAEEIRAKMEELSRLNKDKLCGESADIIRQLLPVLHDSDNGEACDCTADSRESLSQKMHLNIPYLGTINIDPLKLGRCQEEAETAVTNTSLAMTDATSSTPPTSTATAVQAAPQPLTLAPEPNLGFDSMANPSLFLSLDPSLPPELTSDSDTFLALGSTDDQAAQDAIPGIDLPSFPGFTADVGDWAFQGVDTTYWSLVNGGFQWNNAP